VPVIEDIKIMVSSFSVCSLIHVSHNQNTAVHCLARSSESLPQKEYTARQVSAHNKLWPDPDTWG
jgi:hypothetical protein